MSSTTKTNKTVTIDPILIDFFNELAKKENRSFSYFTNLALTNLMEKEKEVDSLNE